MAMQKEIQQTFNPEHQRQRRGYRFEQVGAWLGTVAASTALLAGSLSPSAKAGEGDLVVKETPKVESVGVVIRLDGQRFFPIISWAQSSAEVGDNLDIGINTFMGVEGRQQELVNEINGRAYVVPPYKDGEPKKRSFFGEIGFHLPDEPDGYGLLPNQLPRTPRVEETGRLIFQTLTFHYSTREAKITTSDGITIDDNDYRDYVENADVIGTDLYPLAHGCKNPNFGNQPGGVYDYQKELSDLAGSKPTYQWIEVNQVEGHCGDEPLTPAIVRTEAYLAIAGGADGLGYFTHGWKKNVHDRFDVDPKMQASLLELSEEIESLTPIITAPRLPYTSGLKDPVKIGGRKFRGEHYMIVANSSDRKINWERRLASVDLGNRKIDVYGEDRAIKAKNGWIRDKLDPYEVLIYHWEP